MFQYVNLWAVLAATIAAYIFGWLWYSPILFKKEWLHSLGRTMDDGLKSKKEQVRTTVYGFIVNFIMAYGTAVFLALVIPDTFALSLEIGMLICFAFVITSRFIELLYESHEPHWSKKPQKLFLITVGYQLGNFLIMTAIIWYMSYGMFLQ